MRHVAQSAVARAGHKWLVLMALGLSGLTLAGPVLHIELGGLALIAIFLIGGAAAYAGARIADSADWRVGLIIILAGAVAMRLALLFTDPTLSSDIYRYVWDGRVQAAGINPYRYVPRAPELAHLQDGAIWPHINRADYAVTIYPPAAQMIFLAVTRFGESVAAMKLGLLGSEALAIWAMIALLQHLGLPVTRVATYAWHPLPVWEIAGNGHVDAAMIALLMAALLLFVQGRILLAGIAATAGALIKPVALLALPVFWRPWNWRLPLAFLGTVAVFYAPYLSVGADVLGFLPGYLEEEGLSTGSGFHLLWLIEGIAGPLPGLRAVYPAVAGIVLASLAVAAAFRSDRSDAASLACLRWLLVAFLILVSPHYPWYFLVLVPFLALSPSAAVWVMSIGGVLFYYVAPNPLTPTYESRVVMFTLATLAAVAHDLWSERAKGRATLIRGST